MFERGLAHSITKEDLEKWLFGGGRKNLVPTTAAAAAAFGHPRDRARRLPKLHNKPNCRIDWNVAKRFLQTVYEEGEVRRTRLAMKAGTNYTACNRYMAWMAEINWVTMGEDGVIKLTEQGIAICTRLFVDGSS